MTKNFDTLSTPISPAGLARKKITAVKKALTIRKAIASWQHVLTSIAAILFMLFSMGRIADATTIDYAVLYEGTGGHNLQITNVTVNGNIGVGGTGVVQDNGPSTLNGRLDFSASNTGQFHNNNGANVGPTSVNYNVSAVTTDLSAVNSYSATLSGEAGAAASLAINGNQTVNLAGCIPDAFGNCVFKVTSYHENDGDNLTINGDGVHSVVFDFAAGLNLGGDIILGGGLTPDQVVWNFAGSANVQLNNNASSFPLAFFQGVIIAPNNAISLVNANLKGRVFGGDSSDMQIVSGVNLIAPVTGPGGGFAAGGATPDAASLLLVGGGLVLLGLIRFREAGTHPRAM